MRVVFPHYIIMSICNIGIPHHAAARMKRNSISAKMRRLKTPNENQGGILGAAAEQARAEAV